MKVTLARPQLRGVWGSQSVVSAASEKASRWPAGPWKGPMEPTGYTVSSAAVVSFVLRLPCAGRPRTHLFYAEMKPGRRGLRQPFRACGQSKSSQPPRR